MADRGVPAPSSKPTKCGCYVYCGDLPEREDDPRAVCRGLPMPPHEPLVEIVVYDRRAAAGVSS